MKKALIAAVLAASGAVAEDGPFLKGEALQAEVAKNCADGCITLSPQEAALLMMQLQQAQAEAFKAGTLSCRNAT